MRESIGHENGMITTSLLSNINKIEMTATLEAINDFLRKNIGSMESHSNTPCIKILRYQRSKTDLELLDYAKISCMVHIELKINNRIKIGLT